MAGKPFSDETPVLLAVLVDLLINFFGWFICSYLKTDLVYDLLGACSHIVAVLLVFVTSNPSNQRVQVGCALVALWATRLGYFLFTRILKAGQDVRLEKFKNDPVKFAVPWFLQSLWIIINLSPLLAASFGDAAPSLSSADAPALCAWAAGFVIESVADAQKRAFAADVRNKGRFIRSGLWAWSRHPNYCGELLLWWSFALFCAPAVAPRLPHALVLLSPAFVTLLLTRVSGIPPLERIGKQRWGDDDDYRAYVRDTSVLFPLPRCGGRAPAAKQAAV